MDVSVVIVNFNTGELLEKCLDSVRQHTTGLVYEVIVVDNASVDGSPDKIRENYGWVILVENRENVGFGAANNIGVNFASGKYLFFMNPDCELLNNAILSFYQFMERTNKDGIVAAVGGLLRNEQGQLNYSYQKFPKMTDPVKDLLVYYVRRILKIPLKQAERGNYPVSDADFFEVESIVGADLFILSDVFRKLDGFDEQYFLYFEETDLQRRMEDHGLKRYVIKEPRIFHLEGGSAGNSLPDFCKSMVFNESMFGYLKKYSTKFYFYPLFSLYFMLISVAFLFAKERPASQKKEFLKMLRGFF